MTTRVMIGLIGMALGAGCAGLPGRGGPESRRAALSWYIQGLMHERSAQLTEALDLYRHALEHDYQSPALYVRLGATHVKLGQTEQAVKAFRHALGLDPTNRDALRWMAMLQTSEGKIEEAIDAYERLLEQDQTDRFVLSTLADLYVLQGQLTKAVSLYERLIREYGSSSQLHFNLGVLYGRLGQFLEAIQELSRALELSQDSVEVRLALGLTYELNAQPQKAAALYEDAIRLEPLNPRLYLHAARVHVAAGRLTDAIEDYQTALDLAPDELEAIAGLVRMWVTQRQFAQAHQFLGRQLAQHVHEPQVYLMLGLVYREAGFPHEAIRAFERSLSSAESAQAHFHLGAELAQLGVEDQARRALRRAIELDPTHADALNYLGYLDAEDGVNLQEAKTLIQRALELDPDNGAYLDSLGWVYYQLGDLDSAITYLERAAEQLDTDPTIFEHLGDAYAKRGDLERAQACWQKALELNQELETVTRKLESLLGREAKTSDQ